MTNTHLTSEFASMTTKQWFPIEIGNEIVRNFLLSLISSLDFKPLFVPIEANSRCVYLYAFIYAANSLSKLLATIQPRTQGIISAHRHAPAPLRKIFSQRGGGVARSGDNALGTRLATILDKILWDTNRAFL